MSFKQFGCQIVLFMKFRFRTEQINELKIRGIFCRRNLADSHEDFPVRFKKRIIFLQNIIDAIAENFGPSSLSSPPIPPTSPITLQRLERSINSNQFLIFASFPSGEFRTFNRLRRRKFESKFKFEQKRGLETDRKTPGID